MNSPTSSSSSSPETGAAPVETSLTGLSLSVGELRERYLKLYSGAINDVLRFRFNRHTQTLPPSYVPLRDSMKLAGFAFTVKGAPDLVTEGEMESRARMLEALPPDSVVVWDCTGDTVTAQWGEVMTMAALRAGCRGALVNGVRDTEAILKMNFSVFCQYRTNTGMFGRFRMYHYQQPILIGEVRIEPGDWIYEDIDGVICIPRALVMDVLIGAEAIRDREMTIRDLVAQGFRPTEVVQRGGYF